MRHPGSTLPSEISRRSFLRSASFAARFGHQILIPANEVAKCTDKTCVFNGPVERDVCLVLFIDPRMQATFKR